MGDIQINSADLITQVSNALEHYWEIDKLSKHPLSNLTCLVQFLPEGKTKASALARGRALQQLLDYAMGEAQSLDCGHHSAEARYHHVLQKEYVEQIKNELAAQQLNMSASTFYRVRRDAVQRLAQVIADMERSA